jgi:hypothetical protein
MLALTKADKILVIAIIIASFVAITYQAYALPKEGNTRAEISVDGKLVQVIQLRKGYHQEIRIGGELDYDIIEADGERIRVREADCPDQDCIKTGWISRPPQQIVCLPYKLVIKVVSAEPGDVDVIVH